MELRHLRYFVAVVEHENFTKAAEHLHTAQPSLSRQVRDLEAELGVQLIERSSRHFGLTAAGKAFYDETRSVLAQLERAIASTRRIASDSPLTLSVGFLHGVEIEWLAVVMNAMREWLPSVELLTRSQSSPELIAALHEHKLDLAFIRADHRAQDLIVRPLVSEPLIAVMSANNPLASRGSIQIDDLVSEPFVTITSKAAPALVEIINAHLISAGVPLDEAYEAENLTMSFSLISSINGVGLMPQFARKLLPRDMTWLPLAGDVPMIDLSLAYHGENPLPMVLTLVTALLRGGGGVHSAE